MGRVKARKGETSGVRPARVGEGDAVRNLLAEVARDEQDQMQLAVSCQLLDNGVDTARLGEPFRFLVVERRRTLLGAALVQAGGLGSKPGEHLAELEAHRNLYAQQAGLQARDVQPGQRGHRAPGLHGRDVRLPRTGHRPAAGPGGRRHRASAPDGLRGERP